MAETTGLEPATSAVTLAGYKYFQRHRAVRAAPQDIGSTWQTTLLCIAMCIAAGPAMTPIKRSSCI